MGYRRYETRCEFFSEYTCHGISHPKHPYTIETSTILLLIFDVPKLPFRTSPQTVCYGEVEVNLKGRDKLGGPFTFFTAC